MRLKPLVMLGLLCLASLSVAVLLAYFARWQTAIVGIIPLLSGLVGFLLILFALITWGLAKVRGSAGQRRMRSKFPLLAGVLLLVQLAYIPTAQALRHQAVNQAQTFMASLMPRLEAYKEQHGVYPSAVEAILTDVITPPALLRLQGNVPLEFNNQHFYFQQGTTYGFRFYLPDGFIGFSYEYCCGPHGQWTVTD